jgi:hypothetical protein
MSQLSQSYLFWSLFFLVLGPFIGYGLKIMLQRRANRGKQ